MRPRRMRVYAAVGATALVAAVGVAAVAVWDHANPGASTRAEYAALWYCRWEGTRCDEPMPWHVGWHRRERIYTRAFAGSLTLAALFGIAAAGSRGRRRLSG